ncbi:MAG: ABC transporter ATP-binding protein [Desulfuromonadia bacterium]
MAKTSNRHVAIELYRVTKTFNKGKPSEFTAVSDVTLSLGQGVITVLKGPSGSGKTTLLSLVGCMIRPTSGRIFLGSIELPPSLTPPDGKPLEITSLTERFLTQIRQKTFGFIFQQFNLIKGITVRENILLPLYPLGEPAASMTVRCDGLLDRFSLTRHRDRPVDYLSGGEMQRVAIARALVNDPSVVIADEPTAHLDSTLSRELMGIIGEMKREGKTIIIASHDPIVYDSPLVDRVVEMRDGRVVSSR